MTAYYYYPDPVSLFPAEPSPLTVTLPGGSIVELRPCGHDAYQVQHLISTDPQDYLSSPFRPGAILFKRKE